MNTSHAFRSHLMQQFVSQARTQSRPPLALLGVFSDDNEAQNMALSTGVLPLSRLSSSHLSSINSTTQSAFSSTVRRRHTDSEIFRPSRNSRFELSNLFSTVPMMGEPDGTEDDDDHDHSGQSGTGSSISDAFQNMIQTRRTSGRLVPLKSLPPLYESEQDFWIDALDRAVQCGQQAPNHKRTEPFTFKRMVAVSEATERLADIAYHVDLRQRLQAANTSSKTISSSSSEDRAAAEERAQRKKEKWGQIPAFLVTVVKEETYNEEVDGSCHEYDTLPYQPPLSERALEDYASACAAVQNVLLSLHSENISTKWVTGPVVRTPAFRSLLNLTDNDRVVALVMVGAKDDHVVNRPRRRRSRRSLHGDVLVDI